MLIASFVKVVIVASCGKTGHVICKDPQNQLLLLFLFLHLLLFIRKLNGRSKGEMQAMFLRHEGFLGALGAFMSYEKHGLDDLRSHQLVERFPMGAPYVGGNIHGPPLGNLNEKAFIFLSFYFSPFSFTILSTVLSSHGCLFNLFICLFQCCIYFNCMFSS